MPNHLFPITMENTYSNQNSPTTILPINNPKPHPYFGSAHMDTVEPQDENLHLMSPQKPSFREPYKIRTEDPEYVPQTFNFCTFLSRSHLNDEPFFASSRPEKNCTDVTKEDLDKCEYNAMPIEELFNVDQHTWDSVHGLLSRWTEGKGPKLDSSEIIPCSPPKLSNYLKPDRLY